MKKLINSNDIRWKDTDELPPYSYTCPYCTNMVSSNKGYRFNYLEQICEGAIPVAKAGMIYICPHCKHPTLINGDVQFPGISGVKQVKHLAALVSPLYEEARTCISNGCFTAAVMLCRKIIMNTAVENGAKGNLRFIEYVNYLDEEHLFHRKCKPLLDKIKTKGNEANHEIEQVSQADASLIMQLTYQMLLYIYEIPGELEDANKESGNDKV